MHSSVCGSAHIDAQRNATQPFGWSTRRLSAAVVSSFSLCDSALTAETFASSFGFQLDAFEVVGIGDVEREELLCLISAVLRHSSPGRTAERP